MNCEGERAQARVGADIAHCPLAPDMLLAGRQGQDPTAPAGGVDGLPNETPGHVANKPFAGRKQPDMRSTEVEGITERLAIGRDDVRAHFAGWANRTER